MWDMLSPRGSGMKLTSPTKRGRSQFDVEAALRRQYDGRWKTAADLNYTFSGHVQKQMRNV
jgi:hypothetical protein